MNYEKAGYERTFTELVYNPLTNDYIDSTATVSWSQSKLRFLGRFVYHFGEGDQLTWYTGLALGFTHVVQENPENELDGGDYSIASVPIFIDKITDPLAARIYFGMKYMFSNNVGFVSEIGLGSGSLLTIGLSANFGN